MNYILKHFDKELIKFSFESTPHEGTQVNIIDIYDKHKDFFPLNLTLDNDSLLRWIKDRTIPKNRKFVYKILMALELNLDNLKGIVDISKSLSLNDCYWIVKEDFSGTFKAFNLYDNNFNKTLSLLAYTGYGSIYKSGFMSTPEFTTNGMLAKAWRRSPQGREGVYLYKSGSSDCANCGKEPYSEYYAYQIAKAMDLDVVEYGLGKWKGRLNSICELFTSKEYAFIPIYRLVRAGGWKAVFEYYEQLGTVYYDALMDMILLDVVIVNIDRHFGNFGLLIDNESNTIVKPAPIFDNGLSLFHDALEDDLEQIDEYAQTKTMQNAGDFIAFITPLLRKREKEKIRKLINFKFERHPTYNLPAKRLRIIEHFIARRVERLLEI